MMGPSRALLASLALLAAGKNGHALEATLSCEAFKVKPNGNVSVVLEISGVPSARSRRSRMNRFVFSSGKPRSGNRPAGGNLDQLRGAEQPFAAHGIAAAAAWFSSFFEKPLVSRVKRVAVRGALQPVPLARNHPQHAGRSPWPHRSCLVDWRIAGCRPSGRYRRPDRDSAGSTAAIPCIRGRKALNDGNQERKNKIGIVRDGKIHVFVVILRL